MSTNVNDSPKEYPESIETLIKLLVYTSLAEREERRYIKIMLDDEEQEEVTNNKENREEAISETYNEMLEHSLDYY